MKAKAWKMVNTLLAKGHVSVSLVPPHVTEQKKFGDFCQGRTCEPIPALGNCPFNRLISRFVVVGNTPTAHQSHRGQCESQDAWHSYSTPNSPAKADEALSDGCGVMGGTVTSKRI